jgi:GNAT superfamily N-acetyltransferase
LEFEYSFEREIDIPALQRLLRQTDWANDRSDEGVEQTLRASFLKLGVWRGDELIAFARVFGDGMYRAHIDDVVVDESWRRRGIGSEMLRRIADALGHVEEVSLGCEERVIPFYESVGFRRTPWAHMWLPRE